MINFFNCLGFESGYEAAYKKFFDFFYEHVSMLSLPSVDYGSCITRQGIELWQVKAKESKQANFNFHFHTSTDQKGILLERVEAPSQDIEGVFGIKVGMEEELQSKSLKKAAATIESHTEGYKAFFQPPNYHWYDHLTLPCKATVQLTAFPETIQLFPAGMQPEAENEKKTELGMCYIILTEETQQESHKAAFPLLEFGGIIRALTNFTNEISSQQVCAAVVETAGMSLDVLIPVDKVDRVPRVGMSVHVQSWLTGRVKEVFPLSKPGELEDPYVLLMQTQVAGTYYHDLGVRARGFAFWDELALIQEPHNPYDPQAIAVQSPEGEMIGYIPREKNALLAALMNH